MGNFIQLDPRMFDRGPSTSNMIGQAVGNMAQSAGNYYLQSKIQNMLEDRKRQIDLEAQRKSGRSLYNIVKGQGIEANPEDFENLLVNVQAATSKSLFKDIGTQDYSNKFAGTTDLLRPGGNMQQPQIQTKNITPGMDQATQAQENQQKAYQTESALLNAPNQQQQQQQVMEENGGMPNEASQIQEPPSTQDLINQRWNSAKSEADRIRDDELSRAKNPRQKASIMKAYNAAIKDIDNDAENQRKMSGDRIEADKAVDAQTREDIKGTKAKGELAEKSMQILDEMAQIRARGNLGKLPSLMSAGKALLGGGGILGAAAAYPQIDADKQAYNSLAMRMIQPYAEAQGRGITNTEFPRYAALIPSADDFDLTASQKEDAMRSLVKYDLNKWNIYKSIEKPDGTYPRNAAAQVEKLMADSRKQINKQTNEAIKGPTSLKEAPVGAQFDKLPKGAAMGDMIRDDKGNVLKWDGKSWKKAK